MSNNNDDDDEAGGGRAQEEMEEEEDDDDDDVSEESSDAARQLLLDALDHDATDLTRIRSVIQSHPHSLDCKIDAKGNGDWCSALHMSIVVAADYDVIRYVAKKNPEAVQTRDHNGRLPLHLAVIYRSRRSVVRMLVKMYPQALQETIDDKMGHLPLHCAFLNDYTEDGANDWIEVERHGRPEVTTYLIDQHPEAVRVRTANGHLPLHLAFADDDGMPLVEQREVGNHSVPIETLSALLKAWPCSIFQTDVLGRLALHLACRSAVTRPAVIRRLVEEWPTSLRRRDIEEGNLPIHHAIIYGMPYAVIKFLADESPRSVRELTDDGHLALHLLLMHPRSSDSPAESLALVRLLASHFPSAVHQKEEGILPLHIAAKNDAPLTVIRFLVRAYHDGLLVTSPGGCLPVHLAVWHSESPAGIRFLVDECPRSLQVCRDGRRLALHEAAQEARKLEIVRIVHRAWPDAIREKTDKGYTPLHLVAMRSFTQSEAAEGLSIARYFLDQWPRSVQEASWTGELPVHLAARHASPAMVRLFVERGPKSLLLAPRDKDGALPLHRAVTRVYDPKSAVRVMQYMIETAPDALKVSDSRGNLPLHESVSDPSKMRYTYDWGQRLPIVKHLVKAWPQALEAKDKSGRIPLIVAAESGASLDVLFYLLTTCPQSIGGYGCGGDGRRRSPGPRRSKRRRLA